MPVTYQLIASNTLTTSAASVTFSAIPNTFTDLVLRCSLRADLAQVEDSLRIIINNDATANYSATWLSGNGSAASSGRDSGAGTAGSRLQHRWLNANSATSNTFSNNEIYFANYLSTGTKVQSQFGTAETNATAVNMAVTASQYRGTSAISQLTLDIIGGGNFVAGSSFFLYGIKNS